MRVCKVRTARDQGECQQQDKKGPNCPAAFAFAHQAPCLFEAARPQETTGKNPLGCLPTDGQLVVVPLRIRESPRECFLGSGVGEYSRASGKDIRECSRSSLSFLEDNFPSGSLSAHSFHLQGCLQNNRGRHLINHLSMFASSDTGLKQTFVSFV